MADQRSSNIRPIGDSSEMGAVDPQTERIQKTKTFSWLARGFIAFFILFFLLDWLVPDVYCPIQKKKLEAKGPDFQLESAKISLLKMTTDLTAVGWEVTIVAINPNTKLGLNYQNPQVSVLFNGYGDNYLVVVATQWLQDFFLNNGTQKRISFKLGMVRNSNDPVVAKTRISDGRVTSFGLNSTVSYSYRTDAWCLLHRHRSKSFLWKQVEFQNIYNGTS